MADAVSAWRHYTGFAVAATSSTEVRVQPGRYYNGGAVFANEQEQALNLFQYVPLVTNKIVAVVVWGQEVDTQVEPRYFLVDLQTGATEQQAVAMERARHAEVNPLPGTESADPQPPVVPSGALAVAYVYLTPAGIDRIEMQTGSLLPNGYDQQGRLRLIEAWQAGAEARIASIATDLAALVVAAQEAGMLLDAPGVVDDDNLGPRTLDAGSAPASDTGSLTSLLSGLANRLQAITGQASWLTAPAVSLATLATQSTTITNHVAAKTNPHQVTASQTGGLPLAGGTLSGSLAMGNQALTGVKFLGLHQEYDNGNSGSAKTITLSNGGCQKLALTATCTLTLDPGTAPVGAYSLRIVSNGNWTVSWSGLTATRWHGASSAPPVNYGAGKETLVTVFWNGTAATATQRLEKIGAV
ncbi:MAG: hypothetical protein KA125_15620 [Chromatiaceae bacterium]|nr:hypothetical protein [Chromatiaceae bacterium]